MKKMILGSILIILGFSTGARSQFLPFKVTLVDAGHGGKGASKTNNGGDGHGNAGPSGTGEAWVNWKVSDVLMDSLRSRGYPCFRIRDSLTQNIRLRDRVKLANLFVGSMLLSVHHNGISGNSDWTEIVWCPVDTTDFGIQRSSESKDSILAKKVLISLLEKLQYPDHCKSSNASWPLRAPNCMNCANKFLVRNTELFPAVISEAANLSNTLGTVEELYQSGSGQQYNLEVSALMKAIRSYLSPGNQGFGIVDYKYVSDLLVPQGSTVVVDGTLRNVLYEAVWELNEFHDLEARQEFYEGTTRFRFHHWEHFDGGTNQLLWTNTSPSIHITVDYANDSRHRYEAIYSGGQIDPYFVNPTPAQTRLDPGSSQEIKWTVSPHRFEACSVLVSLSTNNGSAWQPLVGPVKFNYQMTGGLEAGRYIWSVPNQTYPQCKLRIIAFDYVGNRDTVISQMFSIAAPGCTLPHADASIGNAYPNAPRYRRFADASTNATVANRWKFSDGYDTTGSVVIRHYYQGTYSVWHWASNTCGTDSILKTFTVPTCSTISTSDIDHDGIPDGCDNCIATPNPSQADADSNGTGDGCCCFGLTSQTFIRGNVDMDLQDNVDIADLVKMVDVLFISVGLRFPCPVEANVDVSPDGSVDIGDLAVLVDHLFVSFTPMPACGAGAVQEPWAVTGPESDSVRLASPWRR